MIIQWWDEQQKDVSKEHPTVAITNCNYVANDCNKVSHSFSTMSQVSATGAHTNCDDL